MASDEQALAAAREIRRAVTDAEVLRCEGPYVRIKAEEIVAEIIAKHYQPQREAAQQMAEALRNAQLVVRGYLAIVALKGLDSAEAKKTQQIMADSLVAWDSASKGENTSQGVASTQNRSETNRG